MTRAAFVNKLAVEAHGGDVRLYVTRLEQGIRCRRVIAGIHRRGAMVTFGLRHRGLTLHRHGGISFVGVPRSGGTSILWGAVKQRVDRLGQQNRALRLGRLGVFLGQDF